MRTPAMSSSAKHSADVPACPRCGSVDMMRIPRTRLHKFLLRFIPGIRFHRYRCMACHWQGLRRGKKG